MRLFRTVTILEFILFCGLEAQNVYLPVDQPVYLFLERMAVQQYIDYHEDVRPISRIDAAKAVMSLTKVDKTTNVEREEIAWYAREFATEINSLGGDSALPRWHLYSYSDSLFMVKLDPMIGYSVEDSRNRLYKGLRFYGSLGTASGFAFSYFDNIESGKGIDRTREFIPETGTVLFRDRGTSLEYNQITGSVAFDMSWWRFGFGKDFMRWGSGYRSQLILSTKAPPFPFIRLDIYPTSWLRFFYAHAWLQSGVLDSTRSYSTQLVGSPRNIYREKYWASHMLTITPIKGLDISFGESIVYSDGPPNILFLTPILFWRSVDHYLTIKEIGDGNNSQVFLNLRSHLIKNIGLYGTLFIDEIDTDNFFDSEKSRNQLGYTLGTTIVNVLGEDLTFRIEYTRINPWVYSNFVQTQVYESAGYVMGHYIKQNADQFYVQISKRIQRGFEVTAYYDYVRRGSQADISYQYSLPSLPLLYGDVTRTTLAGMNIDYEYLHDLRLKGFVEHTSGSFLSGQNIRLGVTLQYGL